MKSYRRKTSNKTGGEGKRKKQASAEEGMGEVIAYLLRMVGISYLYIRTGSMNYTREFDRTSAPWSKVGAVSRSISVL